MKREARLGRGVCPDYFHELKRRLANAMKDEFAGLPEALVDEALDAMDGFDDRQEVEFATFLCSLLSARRDPPSPHRGISALH